MQFFAHSWFSSRNTVHLLLTKICQPEVFPFWSRSVLVNKVDKCIAHICHSPFVQGDIQEVEFASNLLEVTEIRLVRLVTGDLSWNVNNMCQVHLHRKRNHAGSLCCLLLIAWNLLFRKAPAGAFPRKENPCADSSSSRCTTAHIFTLACVQFICWWCIASLKFAPIPPALHCLERSMLEEKRPCREFRRFVALHCTQNLWKQFHCLKDSSLYSRF